MNSKTMVDNNEKAKSKKKKEPLNIKLDKLDKIVLDGEELSGDDLSAHADALAAAKIALESIKGTIDEAEKIIKSAMLKQYCDQFATTGSPPDLRRGIGGTSSFQVVQYRTAKMTVKNARQLKMSGIDLEPYKEKNSYTIRLSSASKEESRKIIEFMKELLGGDFDKVVSEHVHVGDNFFSKLDSIVKGSLGPGESLNEKMLLVLRVLNPTIQFSKFESDLNEAEGFDLASEFARISAKKRDITNRYKRSRNNR